MIVLKELGFNPKGANRVHKQRLEEVGSPFLIPTVGDVDGKHPTFYKTASPKFKDSNTGSSLFKEINNVDFSGQNLISETVTLRTIDSIVEESCEKGSFNLVKIDIQGAEIVAMQGARTVLRNASFVLLEISV
jgi:FkbM family methyltransferase